MLELRTKADWNKDDAKKIGHIRVDHDGYGWHNVWWGSCADKDTTPEQRDEINEVYREVLKLFPNGVSSISNYLHMWPEIASSDVKGDLYCRMQNVNYWIHLIARRGDYNIYLHCYLK